MFQTILFPIDDSREAREAAKTVASLAKTYNSHLIILSVIEENKEGETAESIMASAEVVSQLLQEAQTAFEQQGIKAEIIEKEGVPSFTICDVADEKEVDLIVMGCRGLGLTEEGVSESVANLVINLSPCPVLIVP